VQRSLDPAYHKTAESQWNVNKRWILCELRWMHAWIYHDLTRFEKTTADVLGCRTKRRAPHLWGTTKHTMAKKATPKRKTVKTTTRAKAKRAPAVKTSLSRPSGKAEAVTKQPSNKKASTKKEKKTRHAALEKQVVEAVEGFHKDILLVSTYSRQFFATLSKSGVALPGKSRKGLAAAARELRKLARGLKQLADK
jgi:hypothetical protein